MLTAAPASLMIWGLLRNLCRAEKRLLGLRRTGPMGSMVPLSLTQWR